MGVITMSQNNTIYLERIKTMPETNNNPIVVQTRRAEITTVQDAGPLVQEQSELDRMIAKIDPNKITPAMRAIINARNVQRDPNASQAQIREAEDLAAATTIVEVQERM